MKYYVKKEWSTVLQRDVYRAYRNPNYTGYISGIDEYTLDELHYKMAMLANSKEEELGEFDTEASK